MPETYHMRQCILVELTTTAAVNLVIAAVAVELLALVFRCILC